MKTVIKRDGSQVSFNGTKIKIAIENAMQETRLGVDEKLAGDIIKGVGGKGNVNDVYHCQTRLRFKLADEEKADGKGPYANLDRGGGFGRRWSDLRRRAVLYQ